MDFVLQQLYLNRQEPLDMGIKGNSFLHLRYAAQNIALIDEISSVIDRKLVDEKKSAPFVPIPDSETVNKALYCTIGDTQWSYKN